MKRKITLLLCSAALAACLITGCGGDDDKSDNSTDTSAGEEQSVGDNTEDPADGETDSQDDYGFEEQEVFE